MKHADTNLPSEESVHPHDDTLAPRNGTLCQANGPVKTPKSDARLWQ